MLKDICFIFIVILFGGGVPFFIEKIAPKFFSKIIVFLKRKGLLKESSGAYGYWEVKTDELPVE